MNPVKVGLLGLGTVGGGTATVLKRNAQEITRRAGRGIEIDFIATLEPERAAELGVEDIRLTSDAYEVVNDPDIDIVVELIGGYSPAKELVLQALENGKHVITANKALIATHGAEIFAKAQQKGVMVAFEAAVAGGISPLVELQPPFDQHPRPAIQVALGDIGGASKEAQIDEHRLFPRLTHSVLEFPVGGDAGRGNLT